MKKIPVGFCPKGGLNVEIIAWQNQGTPADSECQRHLMWNRDRAIADNSTLDIRRRL